ncbi:unnamed protein product, partial [marine sediment metagenome]
KHNERIQKHYLAFLLEIVKHYFKVAVPKKEGVKNFLGFL